MFSSVLVAIDRWEHATRLLDLAKRVSIDGAKIEVIYIDRSFPQKLEHINYIDNYIESSEKNSGEQIVRDALFYLLSSSTFDVNGCVAGGDVAKMIIERAKVVNCDVIVLGHRALSRINRFLDPSIVAKVIDKAHCPVLIDNSFNFADE